MTSSEDYSNCLSEMPAVVTSPAPHSLPAQAASPPPPASPLPSAPPTAAVEASVEESGKEAKRLAKTLRKLLTKVETALDQSTAQGKDLEHRAEGLAANRDEVEKVMMEHVNHLHGMIDHHHQLHRDMLRQRHKHCLQQLLETHMESQNYQAKLTDLKKRVEDSLTHVTENTDAVLRPSIDVTSMWNDFNAQSAKKPQVQVSQVTYTADVPELQAEPLADIVGRFIVSQQFSPSSGQGHPLSTPSQTSNIQPVSAAASATASATFTTSAQTPSEADTPPAPTSPAGKIRPLSSKVSQQASACTASPVSSKAPAQASYAACLSSETKGSVCPAASHPPQPAASVVSQSGGAGVKGPPAESSNEAEMKRLLKPLLAQKASRVKSRSDALSLTMVEGSFSQVVSFVFRVENVVDMAPTEDHKAWVLYGDGERCLGLLHQEGNVMTSTTLNIDRMPSHVASVDKIHVLLGCPGGLLLLKGTEVLGSASLPEDQKMTSISPGSTGIAISFSNSLYWFGLDRKKNHWLIPREKKPKLTGVCSTAVLTLDGVELVFAVVKGTQEVAIFEKKQASVSSQPSFRGRAMEGLNSHFKPLCVSAHPSGFVAVLDSHSNEVVILNVRTFEMVSIIAGERLCRGVPVLLAFDQDDSKDWASLWVCSDACMMYRAPLSFYCP